MMDAVHVVPCELIGGIHQHGIQPTKQREMRMCVNEVPGVEHTEFGPTPLESDQASR